ncbi:MAG: cell division protein FtsZ [Crocinitomicaceae bacterium]|nr:cell division protein FtsZ [Crocinitomicaceae bacterium]MDP4760688.1 cell division protein FtsZ [Crocinitomicaceae bacterium]
MEFDLPKMGAAAESNANSIIKVIGVGGGGSNAVNHMFLQGIVGVDFIVCNTDRQALDISPVPHKIQLGPNLTEGRGAGMIPEMGMNAAIENIEEIREILSKNTKMVFVTAGMGGGTGTGAAPVIAQVAKDLGILTVGIVTVPFNFEGRKRRQQAQEGLDKMRQNVDTLLIINNERLREFGKDMSLSSAFSHADNVLTVAAKGIAEVISVTGTINVDFNDVNTVLRNSGQAIMGSAIAEGEDRAIVAVKEALTSPLLNDNDINGASYVLLNITYGEKEVMMDEITEITDYIQDAAGATADVIWGHGYDANLGDKLCITLIATGFSSSPITGFEKAPERKIVALEDENKKEILNPLESPVQHTTIQTESVQEPFLKADEPVVNEVSYTSPSAAVNVLESPIMETTRFELEEPMVNEVVTYQLEEEQAPVAEMPTFEVEPTLNHVEEENAFTWDVMDVTSNDVEEEIVYQAPVQPVAQVNEPQTIVRHMLEDDVEERMSIEPAKRILSPEEQQRKAQERVSRIQEYTAKLKKAEGILEFENEPAFVRRNIAIQQTTPSNEERFSRFGLSQDEDGRVELRSNNFLHDNVD